MPVARVESRRREDGRIFAPIAPLAVRESVHPEVQEHRELVPLPRQLRCARHGQSGRRLPNRPTEPRAEGEGDHTRLNELSTIHALG